MHPHLLILKIKLIISYEKKHMINSTYLLQLETNCTKKGYLLSNWESLAPLTAFNVLSGSSYSMNKKLVKKINGFFKMQVRSHSEWNVQSKHSPFSVTILRFWIVISEDFTVLRKYFGDIYSELVEGYGRDFRNTVNFNNGGHFKFLLQYEIEQHQKMSTCRRHTVTNEWNLKIRLFTVLPSSILSSTINSLASVSPPAIAMTNRPSAYLESTKQNQYDGTKITSRKRKSIEQVVIELYEIWESHLGC